jgi:hypothetical protein
MADLAIAAVGALGNALTSDPSLIVKGIGLLLGGVLVVAAAQAAATIVGTAYTVAMKVAATAAGAIADFAQGIASAIITKLTTMAAAGGIVGTAIGAAMKIGALAAEGFGNIGAAIAGVIGDSTPVVTAAAQAQGTAAGAAGAVSFGAALAAGLTLAAVAAVAAAWAIINDGLNKQVAAVQARLNEVIGQQNLTQLNIDKAAIGTGIANIMSIPFGETLYGDQLKSLRAQLDQVDAQIAQVKAAASAAPSGPNWSSGHDIQLVAVPEKPLPKLVAVPEPKTPGVGDQLLAAGTPKQQLIDAGLLPGKKTVVPKAVVPSAAALATAPVTAATSAAAQAATATSVSQPSASALAAASLAGQAAGAAGRSGTSTVLSGLSLEPAGGITGAGGALDMTSGATTGGTAAPSTGGTGSGYAGLIAALNALPRELLKVFAAGIQVTLDGQAIGEVVDRGAYTSASMATSGFVATGSIG